MLPAGAAPVFAPFSRAVSSSLARLEANGDIEGQHELLLLTALWQRCCQRLRLVLASQPCGSSRPFSSLHLCSQQFHLQSIMKKHGFPGKCIAGGIRKLMAKAAGCFKHALKGCRPHALGETVNILSTASCRCNNALQQCCCCKAR